MSFRLKDLSVFHTKTNVFRFIFLNRKELHYSYHKQTHYGLIGLGQMGFNMAKNLQSNLSTSDSLSIFDIDSNSVKRFIDKTKDFKTGASVNQVSSVFEAAQNSKVIVTVLPDSPQVKEVYRQIISTSSQNNSEKITNTKEKKNRNRLFIDCSTIDPMTSKEIARMVHESEEETSDYVDAPMSGGVTAAKQSCLTFMLGCPDNSVSQITSILQKLGGKRVIHCGPQSLGLAGKLANNYLLAINNIATAEAMRLGIKWGLDPITLSQLINQSTGRCWPSAVNNPVKGVSPNAPANRDYMGGFSLGLMKKDLSLAVLSAQEVGLQLELVERARELYEGADTVNNYKGKDFSIIYKYLEMKDSKLQG